MKPGHLSSYFDGVATKRLSSVEVDPRISHQHEFNGVNAFRRLLGEDRKSLETRFVYLGTNEEDTLISDVQMTWYDSRENHPARSEYRFYYPPNEVTDEALPGDLLVIAKIPERETMLVIIARSGSVFESNIIWLFNLDTYQDRNQGRFSFLEVQDRQDRELDVASRLILEQIGVELVEEVAPGFLDQLIEKFGNSFPTTAEFSKFARQTLSGVVSREDPDGALYAWVSHEELLFRTFEKHLVSEQIASGFTKNDEVDVEAFIKLSKSILNRRKSRAGTGLENHFEQILKDFNVTYSRGSVTENKAKPDFIFPHIDKYKDNSFPATNLTMLGVKYSCKDRWRQVLSEAIRIPSKHLLTLEPAISTNQINEMRANRLQLVLPKNVHNTYKTEQMGLLMDVRSFLALVSELQTA